jgi:hypothetical glycosyl hydrolase
LKIGVDHHRKDKRSQETYARNALADLKVCATKRVCIAAGEPARAWRTSGVTRGLTTSTDKQDQMALIMPSGI